MPLGYARRKTVQTLANTARAGINTGKAGLRGVSIQAGPFIKVRPFDFR